MILHLTESVVEEAALLPKVRSGEVRMSDTRRLMEELPA